MQLVEKAAHDAVPHRGGFAEYLDWVAKVIEEGKLDTLSDDQATAIIRTLKNEDLCGRVKGRLDDSVKILVKHLKKKGVTVTIKEGGEVVATLAGKRVGRKLLGTVLRVGGGVAVVTFFWSVGDAYAETDSAAAASLAGLRDLTGADAAE